MPSKPEADLTEDAPEPPSSSVPSRPLWHTALVIIFGILATTLAQPTVLGGLSIRLLLKDQLQVSKTGLSLFVLLAGLAWYFKPFAGILTDAFPIFRTRRRHYLLISATLATVTWLVIAGIPKTYASLLYGCIVLSAFMVLSSTVIGAFLVEAGQQAASTGRLTSVRLTVQNFCSVIAGIGGGMLAKQSQAGRFFIVAAVNAVIAGSIVPVAYLFLREAPAKRDVSALRTAGEQLRIVFASRTLWFAILFLGLFYFVPGFGTVLLYRQTDQLHFTTEQIGLLGSMQGGTGIIGAVCYGFLIRKFNIKSLIIAGVVLNSLGTLFYLWYNGFTLACFIDSQNQFFFSLCEVSLMDLAARATPAGCEGLGYSLALSVRNLALQGADLLGSVLSDHHWKYSSLVFLNAGTTAFVLVLLPLLPSAIMRSRDSALASAA